MKLKHAIIETMDRDLLKAVCNDLEIDGIDRRSREDMATAVSRARRAKPEDLLEYLSEKQVRSVCELMWLEVRGRRGALIEHLLNGAGQATPLGERRENSNERKRRTSADRPRRNHQEDEVSWMSADEIQEPTSEKLAVPPRQDSRPTTPPRGAPGYRPTRTELVWPGKYDEEGNVVEPSRVALPFQLIEVIEEGRASREALVQGTLPLFGARPSSAQEDGWRNKLIWGDSLHVMGSLTSEFSGKIDLIYIDPPFATGADFSLTTEIGGDEVKVEKEPSSIEMKAYRDMWSNGKASFMAMLAPRLQLMRELLSPSGMILAHFDDNIGHEAKLVMDDIFGERNFRGEIIWQLGTGAKSRKFFSIQHNLILAYSRGDTWTFNTDSSILREPFAEGSLKTHFRHVDEKGRNYRVRTVNGKDYRYYADEGRMIGSVWTDVPSMVANSPIIDEATGYPTQKPEKLLQRIIVACSKRGDLVADFFCGSGTTPVVAERLDRRWIACDLGRFAIHVTRKRLLDVRVKADDSYEERGSRPFEVLNLGKYERRYWQGIMFGDEPQESNQAAITAYVRFVLDLYNAQPHPGHHIHGKRGGVLIHVGAVDAPVTIGQVDQALLEAKGEGASELHILGWEWEMGLHDPLTKMAKAQHGVTLRLLNIPREVMDRRAVEAGDVQFFDLAFLDVEVKPTGKGAQASRRIKVRLKDFVIPNTDLIPDEVRSKIRKWSDYIDYWAVDWDFRDDTFVNQWQTYRTRRDRTLALETTEHAYEAPGKYRILVKVVDIFGNDTRIRYLPGAS